MTEFRDRLVRTDTFVLGWRDRFRCLLTVLLGGEITIRTDTRTELERWIR